MKASTLLPALEQTWSLYGDAMPYDNRSCNSYFRGKKYERRHQSEVDTKFEMVLGGRCS